MNLTALEDSFLTVIKRHESLRTYFLAVDGKPVQRILPEENIKFNIKVTQMKTTR